MRFLFAIPFNAVDDSLDILLAQQMMHGQAYHLFRHLVGVGEVLPISTLQILVDTELADEGVVIPPSKQTSIPHLEIEFVASHAVFSAIHEDGKVAVVVLHTGHIVPKSNAFYIA